MADFVFNIAKGRVAELVNRVENNDPANSAIVIVPIDAGAVGDSTLEDMDDLATVLAAVTEVTTGNWSRKTLTDSDLSSASSVDDSNDRMDSDLPDQTWTGVTEDTTDLLICYDGDTTGGTDSNIIPLTCHDFAITGDGSDVTATITDFFRAS